MVSTTPAFNLKVVLQETGLAADTLRAWERRYGLPVPQRTPGGHRLYSQQDIETIKWLMQRQTEGFSISRAVDMWNEQLASGRDPLAGSAPTTLTYASSSSIASLDTLRSRWVKACTDFNEATAEQMLNQAFSMFSVEAVCLQVLQKGLSEIGTLWFENHVSVQQEHFASGLAMRRLDALLSATPSPTHNITLIVGCPPDEWHTFTPLLLTLLIRRRGINVIFLGANVPTTRFSDAVKNVKAELVILVAQQLTSAATLQLTALALANQNIHVAFGGRIFNIHPDLAKKISGYFLGVELESALEEIETVLRSRIIRQNPTIVAQAYATAYQAYISGRAQIEQTVREILGPLALLSDDLKTGMDFLGENITAALQLGDINHVSAEVDWLKKLLQAYGTPPEQLIHFMEAYSQAVDQNINGQGKPIFEWLDAEIQKLRA
jgi:DNA-binding transcriptional MerR regulator